MRKVVHIEQSADGRWVVVRETLAGEREVVDTCESLAEAEVRAKAATGQTVAG